jgi:hypothetical protein
VALEEGTTARRQPARRWLARLAWVVVPVAVVGEAGHHLLDRLGQAVAHHVFHLLFAGGAAIVFFGYVAVNVRRHGWPVLSWRATDRGASPDGAG